MAKRGESTPSIKRTKGGRRHLSRAEKERRTNHIVLGTTAALVVVIMILLIGGIIYELAIKPNQAVASVGDVKIKAIDFERRFKLEQYQTIINHETRCSENLRQYFAAECEQWEQQLKLPTLMGQSVLNKMIKDEIIRQEAAARGISVSEEEIQDEINQMFSYDPNPETPEPTDTPAPTATPRYTATPTNTPLPTATLAEDEPTATLTLTPSPTNTPVNTLTAEEAKTEFDKTYTGQVNIVGELAGIDEETYLGLVEIQLLREKLADTIGANIPAVADQVHIRQMKLSTEQDAIEIIEALRDGESFAVLANRADAVQPNAEDPYRFRGGDLGWLPLGRLMPEIGRPAFDAEVGEVLGPIRGIDIAAMQQGMPSEYFYVVQVLGHEVRPVAEDLLARMRREHFDTWLNGKVSQAEAFDVWKDHIPESVSLDKIVDVSNKYLPPDPTATEVSEE